MNGVINGKNYNASALFTYVGCTVYIRGPESPQSWDEVYFGSF